MPAPLATPLLLLLDREGPGLMKAESACLQTPPTALISPLLPLDEAARSSRALLPGSCAAAGAAAAAELREPPSSTAGTWGATASQQPGDGADPAAAAAAANCLCAISSADSATARIPCETQPD